MPIKELRILPPLAIGRLGAAPEPLANYTVTVKETDPLGFRTIQSAETLLVDQKTGELSSVKPEAVIFKEKDGSVRPVAPFLEVWALTSADTLEPLTLELLANHGLSPSNVKWEVQVGNIKIFRRTEKADDKIIARTGPFSDHEIHELKGECANFLPGKHLPLGSVRYIKPTKDFPEIRLRFTPAGGYVYGSSAPPGTPKKSAKKDANKDDNVKDVLYDGSKGKWAVYVEKDPTVDLNPRLTNPAQIFANTSDDDNAAHSLGYFDDECDGIVSVTLSLKEGSEPLTAFARIGAGPPAYAPDSFPVRTVADDLEQALLGPKVSDADATMDRAEDIVRRAFETIRLMNTAVMNGNTLGGRVDVASTMSRQDTADTGRLFEPIMAPSLVDGLAIRDLHQNVFTALRTGMAPWFGEVLRNFNEIGDLSAKGRRKMPAMMRGADGRYLALTRRQVELVRKAARSALFEAPTPASKDGNTK